MRALGQKIFVEEDWLRGWDRVTCWQRMTGRTCSVRQSRTRWQSPRVLACAIPFCLGLLVLGVAADTTTNRFGFAGKEIFPIDFQISQLHGADLDGDGLNDLIVVNNARSKLTLLYNQTGKSNATEKLRPQVKRELNELPPDARFRIESIASEKRISSLVLADVNGDRRPDIIYFGEPRELVVLYNEGQFSWSAPKRFLLDEGLLNANALAAGDLNGDGRTDVALLAEGFIYYLKQTKEHSLTEPEKIPYSGNLQALQILDIQGDGREDLLLVNWESSSPFRFRLQSDSGQLGPEMHFTVPSIRSYLAEDLDGDHKTEVITIAQKSGRAQVAQFIQKASEPLAGTWQQGQFEVLPLNRSSKARRGCVWADVTGDGLPDLLVAEPDSGELTLHIQSPGGTLSAAKTFPTFTGVSDLAVADWDNSGKPEIFVLSPEERQIGVTTYDEKGGIPFPKSFAVDGRPLALTVGPIGPDGKLALVSLIEQDGRREIRIWNRKGEVKRQKLSEAFKANPSSISIHDLNQDGLSDIIILAPYERIKVLLQVAGADYLEQDIIPPGGTAEEPWLGAADVDGDGKPELLLAQRNFVRAVLLQADSKGAPDSKTSWSLVVKEQINGASSSSRIAGAAALHNGTNRFDSLFLLDAERKAVTLCDRNAAGTWQVVRTLPLPVSEFRNVQPLALGGKEPNSIAFVGANSVAWMNLRGPVWEFSELDGYETPVRDGYLNDVVAGDLNQDGRKDLVFLEIAKSYIDIATFEPPHELVPANRWQVFEERTFRNRRSEAPEPREALILDVTGDGKNDLVVLVHDRLILYPQE